MPERSGLGLSPVHPPPETGGRSPAGALEAARGTQLTYVLSYIHAGPLLGAHSEGALSAQVSLDLGLSQTVVELDERGVKLPDGQSLPWSSVQRVNDQPNTCFTVVDNEVAPIRALSEFSQRVFQLMPTAGAPALLVAGFTMHRFRDVDPFEGAGAMVRALAPLRGRLLDTATGLGYAAIQASKFAREVVTIELDPMAQTMVRANPWSRALFGTPTIRQLLGDSSELITSFDSASFDAVLHDPPAVNLAGELYAESFYAEVHRVLVRGGRLFHYIGDPKSSSGARTTKGVIRRLQSAGFERVVAKPDAFGVLATKGR